MSNGRRITQATEIAPGVKRVSLGEPFASHVYLIGSPEGPIAFDAGVRGSGAEILAAAGGRLDRVVLSHAHVDHRGAANELDAPVYCHSDEVADAEGDAGRHYTDYGLIESDVLREALPRLHADWDGGPVEIAGTVADAEQVGDFRVIHIPGHAPGQIALFRESDRVLLAADAVFTSILRRGDQAESGFRTHSATGTPSWRETRSPASCGCARALP